MARKSVTKESYRTLFAKTGNQCAFPGCTHPLVDDEGDFVAQICHIEAAAPDGQRFNPNMTDEERADPSNLLVLCYRHHVKTNNVGIYTVEVLKRMKLDHERIWSERQYVLPDEVVDNIFEDELAFWREVDIANSNWLKEFDLAVPVIVDPDPRNHLESILRHVEHLNGLIDTLRSRLSVLPEEISQYLRQLGYDTAEFDDRPYSQIPFWNIEWEMLNLGVPNWINHIRCDAMVLRIYLIYQALKAAPNDDVLTGSLKIAKGKLMEFAKNEICVD